MALLENRPITQKALYGSGAFAFVFLAAMAGTAFMISGGFGFGGDRADGQRAQVVYQDWGDWHVFEEPTPVRVQPAAARVEEPVEVEDMSIATDEELADRAQAASSADDEDLVDAPITDDDYAPAAIKPPADPGESGE